MAKLIIDGVNKDNHDLLNLVAGNYGYLGLVRVEHECCYSIELWEALELDRKDNLKMEAEFKELGFDVKVHRDNGVNDSVAFHHMY